MGLGFPATARRSANGETDVAQTLLSVLRTCSHSTSSARCNPSEPTPPENAPRSVASFEGPIGYQVRDLTITADDGIAFCHSLNQVRAMRTDSQKLEMWWRATLCFRRIGGRWLLTHQHNSVPFDGESGRAAIGLKP
jgi:hypothetical protein